MLNNNQNNMCEQKTYEQLVFELNQERIKNNNLLTQLNNEKSKVKELNDKIKLLEKSSNKKILELQKKIELKNIELNNLKSIEQFNPNEKYIGIIFETIDQKIRRPMACKSTELFSRLEEKVYNEYPEYKEFNTYLTSNGKFIKRFKTLEEKEIQDGNSILINIYE